uniref:LigA n=1 Tax=Parastrongyloides trichosuri TaxID=131310 RepID=A0A0N5A080_PARTI
MAGGAQASVEAGDRQGPILEHGQRQVVRPVMLGRLHRIAPLANQRRAHAQRRHQTLRPGPGRDDDAISIDDCSVRQGDLGGVGHRPDGGRIGVDRLPAFVGEGGQQGVAHRLRFADLAGAGEPDSACRALTQDGVIGGQFLSLHHAEARPARARGAPAGQPAPGRFRRGPDHRMAGRPDQSVWRLGQGGQTHPGADRIIQQMRQNLGPVSDGRRAGRRQEPQRPWPPQGRIARTKVQRPAKGEQPPHGAPEGRGRGHGLALLGGDMADVAEGGAASRVAPVDQRGLKTRRLKPKRRRRPDQPPADDCPAPGCRHAAAPSANGSSRLCDGSGAVALAPVRQAGVVAEGDQAEPGAALTAKRAMFGVDEGLDLGRQDARFQPVAGAALDFQSDGLGAGQKSDLGRRFDAALGDDQRAAVRDAIGAQNAAEAQPDKRRRLIVDRQHAALGKAGRRQRIGAFFLFPGQDVARRTRPSAWISAPVSRSDGCQSSPLPSGRAERRPLPADGHAGAGLHEADPGRPGAADRLYRRLHPGRGDRRAHRVAPAGARRSDGGRRGPADRRRPLRHDQSEPDARRGRSALPGRKHVPDRRRGPCAHGRPDELRHRALCAFADHAQPDGHEPHGGLPDHDGRLRLPDAGVEPALHQEPAHRSAAGAGHGHRGDTGSAAGRLRHHLPAADRPALGRGGGGALRRRQSVDDRPEDPSGARSGRTGLRLLRARLAISLARRPVRTLHVDRTGCAAGGRPPDGAPSPGWRATPPARPAPAGQGLHAGESLRRSGQPPGRPDGSARPARSRLRGSCRAPPPSGGRTGCGLQAEMRPCGSSSRKGWADDLEARPEGILAVHPDGVEAGGDGRTLDRGHDRLVVAHRGLGFDAADEPAADVAFVDEGVADLQPPLGVQMSQPRRGAGAAGAAVDGLVAIEDGVAAVGALTLGLVGPQHVADPVDRGFVRVHRVEGRPHPFAHQTAQFDDAAGAQIVQARVGALRLDDGVVVAAVGHVDAQRAEARHVDLDAFRRQIGGDIADAHRGHLVALSLIGDVQNARRDLDLQPARRARPDQAVFQPEGDHADRPVAAHGQAAAGLDEQDARVCIRQGRRIQEAAAHHVVAARLETQGGADPVVTAQEVEPTLGHAGP